MGLLEAFGLTFYHGRMQVEIAESLHVGYRQVRRLCLEACVRLHEAVGDNFPSHDPVETQIGLPRDQTTMPTDVRLIDVLGSWQAAVERGEALDLADLCQDRPDLIPA